MLVYSCLWNYVKCEGKRVSILPRETSGNGVGASPRVRSRAVARTRPYPISPQGRRTEKMAEIAVFISYAHADEKWRQELDKQLSNLRNQGVIFTWHDRQISAGMEWEPEIIKHLEEARLILLLISADFMASKFCYSVELKRAIERHNAGEAVVIPIILRYVDWQGAPFAKLQVLPTEGKPVVSSKWHNTDEAFYDVIQGIRVAIEKLQKQQK